MGFWFSGETKRRNVSTSRNKKQRDARWFLGTCPWPGLIPRKPHALEPTAGSPLTGLPGLGLLSSRSTTFHPAATICLGKAALWAQLQQGPEQQPRQTSFHHRSQSLLGLTWCQPKSGQTLPHPPEG